MYVACDAFSNTWGQKLSEAQSNIASFPANVYTLHHHRLDSRSKRMNKFSNCWGFTLADYISISIRFDSIRLWIMSAVDWLKPHFRKLKQCSTRHIEFEKWELMIRSALYTFRKESMWKRFRSSWIGQYHWMRSMPRQFDCHALQRSTIFDVRCLNTQ